MNPYNNVDYRELRLNISLVTLVGWYKSQYNPHLE